jgi:hypothetical protein
MTTILGRGDYVYSEAADWPDLPEDLAFREVVDVAVDADDLIYLFCRGEQPIIVVRTDGSFVGAWGEGLFARPHGLTIGPDGSLFCADDLSQCLLRLTPGGELLETMGSPGEAAPKGSGRPFDRPTKIAFDPDTGDRYVADGYGNARVHKYSADGRYLFSWGDYGSDPGQFNLVHSIATDDRGRVYVADRENHRVQVFDHQGNYLSQWNNLHRPCGLHVAGGLAYVGQLPTALAVNASYPNLGACVSIHNLAGQRLARLGDRRVGEGPGQFTAPHGLTVDAKGNLYVGEVSWTHYGSRLDPPRKVRSVRKLIRLEAEAND